MTHMKIEVAPLTGALGAEIFGVDVSQPLPDATIAEIRRALVDYSVIFFRDQKLDAEQQKAFTRRFAPIFIHPNYDMDRADMEIVELRREPGDRKIVGEDWHTDTTMMASPPLGAILYGMEVPAYGGDTLFASQFLAFDALSESMKTMLRPLRAVHTDRKVAGPVAAARNDKSATKIRDADGWQETQSLHPVVCLHPESQREYLFVNTSYTTNFEGMTERESAPLLNFLYEHGNRSEFCCRFRWRQGSIAFWDNRGTKHSAIDDAGRFVRHMRRVQLVGHPPIQSTGPVQSVQPRLASA